MKGHILAQYGNQIRIRVSGLCLIKSKLVLVKHEGIGKHGVYWSPPGGGVQFGESLSAALKREFLEEVNLEIKVGRFLFIHEFIGENLHAIELFFEVQALNGQLSLGKDPEHSRGEQILKEVKVFSEDEVNSINPMERHQIFELASNFDHLLRLEGYFKSENNSIK